MRSRKVKPIKPPNRCQQQVIIAIYGRRINSPAPRHQAGGVLGGRQECRGRRRAHSNGCSVMRASVAAVRRCCRAPPGCPSACPAIRCGARENAQGNGALVAPGSSMRTEYRKCVRHGGRMLASPPPPNVTSTRSQNHGTEDARVVRPAGNNRQCSARRCKRSTCQHGRRGRDARVHHASQRTRTLTKALKPAYARG